MPESIKITSTLISELSEARVIQAVMAIILTLAVASMYVMQKPIPTELSGIWLLIIGLYLELPSTAIKKT